MVVVIIAVVIVVSSRSSENNNTSRTMITGIAGCRYKYKIHIKLQIIRYYWPML